MSRREPPGESGDPSSASAVPSVLAGTVRPEATVRFDAEAVRAYQEKQQLRGSLLVIDGVPADVGRHIVVEQRVVIGRDAAGLQIRDGRTSRQHAQVERSSDGDHVVRDLGSTNGTLLNGQRVATEQPLRDGDRIEIGQTVIKFTLVDETEAAYLRRMDQLAGTDELTGLMAKHRFDSLLQEALRSARRSGAALAVAMMDLDGLKAINEANGHQMGAKTIGEVGRLLGRAIHGRGEACRFGGDEFCAFLTAHDLQSALGWARELCQQVRELTVTLGSRSTVPSISIGVAERPPDIETEEALVHLADEALYRAKNKGRNGVSS